MNNRLLEIALKLGELYSEQANLTIHQSHLSEDREGRRLFLTPADGWPGKNEEQRKSEAARSFAGDQVLVEIGDALREIGDQLTALDAQIRALEVERKAHEWGIRGALVSALRGETAETPEVGTVEETAFDAAADMELDEAATTAAAADVDPDMETELWRAAMQFMDDIAPAPAVDDSIPF